MDTSLLTTLAAANPTPAYPPYGIGAGAGAAAGAGIGLGVGALGALLLSEGIGNKTQAIQTAISDSVTTLLAADQAAHLANQKATMDASIAGINATNLNSVATIKQVTDSNVAITKAVTDAALSSALSSSEIRELIGANSLTTLLSIKDNLSAIKDEGCRTREKETEHYAAIQLEACKNTDAIERMVLKTNAELSKQISDCCCETKELILQQSNETRDLIRSSELKRLEVENSDLKMQLLLKNNAVIK